MNVKKLFVLLVIGMSWLVPTLSYAWNDTAHILIAQIAKEYLNLGVMDKIVDLVEDIDGEFPPPFDFETAACWADDISRYGMKGLDSWHEKLIPYDPCGILTEEKRNELLVGLEKNSVTFALTEAVRTLKDPESCSWGKNFMLRILLHCIGDIHHPLHCATLYSPDFTCGDEGGQFFKISGRKEKSLREFWDNLAGNSKRSWSGNHYPTYEETIEMELTMDKILADFPFNSFTKNTEETFNDWAEESYQLAVQFAYQNITPGSNLSKEYVELSRRIAYRQIALAGYRLAEILNEVFMD